MKKNLYNLSIREFLRRISFKESRIGGGSVACLCGALSVSLFQLAGDFSFKGQKKKNLLRRKLFREKLQSIRERIEKLIDEDARAFYKKDDYVSACKVCVDCFVLLKKFYSAVKYERVRLNERLLADIVLAESLFLAALENIILNLEENMIYMKSAEHKKVYKRKIKEVRAFYKKINSGLTRRRVEKRYGKIT